VLGLGSDGATARSRALPVPELRPGRAQAPRSHPRAGDAGRRRAQPDQCAAYSATASGPTARSDPAHDQVVTGIAARLARLSRRAVMLAEDATRLSLPHVRASRTLRGLRPGFSPGHKPQGHRAGVVEVSTGAWAR
jgi:hypothetical protein